MKPRRTPYSNQVFRLEGGTEDNDLWAEVTTSEQGPCIRSVWQPTDEERHRLAIGDNIYLVVWGIGQPPVALGVTDDPLAARLLGDALTARVLKMLPEEGEDDV